MIINKESAQQHKLLQTMILNYMSENDGTSTKDHTLQEIWNRSVYNQQGYKIVGRDETKRMFDEKMDYIATRRGGYWKGYLDKKIEKGLQDYVDKGIKLGI